LIDQGENLSTDPSCNFTAQGSAQNVAITLPALANNGGFTQTFALPAGSPAIDAGDDGAAPTTDQRHASRVGRSDIGAFEFNGALAELRLSIQPQTGTNVLISWPSSTTASLESTPAFSSTSVWTKVSNVITNSGGTNRLTLPAASNLFFRLHK
jgi:hypothetical protein